MGTQQDLHKLFNELSERAEVTALQQRQDKLLAVLLPVFNGVAAVMFNRLNPPAGLPSVEAKTAIGRAMIEIGTTISAATLVDRFLSHEELNTLVTKVSQFAVTTILLSNNSSASVQPGPLPYPTRMPNEFVTSSVDDGPIYAVESGLARVAPDCDCDICNPGDLTQPRQVR